MNSYRGDLCFAQMGLSSGLSSELSSLLRQWFCRPQGFCTRLSRGARRITRPERLTVRLEATVAPDGKVRDTKVIGGSPLLVQEAVTAVKKWKYEEASKESVENVEVVFQ